VNPAPPPFSQQSSVDNDRPAAWRPGSPVDLPVQFSQKQRMDKAVEKFSRLAGCKGLLRQNGSLDSSPLQNVGTKSADQPATQTNRLIYDPLSNLIP
jgi:hypothetical protein